LHLRKVLILQPYEVCGEFSSRRQTVHKLLVRLFQTINSIRTVEISWIF
jgi:hypothetical protein